MTTTSSSSSSRKQPAALPDHTLTLCRSRLGAALRTALACTIVGVASVYSPPTVRRYIKFPAFSYAVTLLIVGDATLGDTLRCTLLATYATILGLLPAILTSYIIRSESMSAFTASAAAAVSAFVVVISDSTGLLTKRIALGQIVLIYVAAFDFEQTQLRPVLQPVPVLASTVVGVAAAVMALVVPYPRLAYEVREKSKLYSEIATERLRLLLNAFCADNSYSMAASISLAKSISRVCTKLLKSVRVLQEPMKWERPPLKFLPPFIRTPSERIEAIETSLKGMEMALSSTSVPPLKLLDQLQLRDDILNLQDPMSGKIRGVINPKSGDNYNMDITLGSLHDFPQSLQQLPPFFFLFCMKLLFDGTLMTAPPSPQVDKKIIPTTEQKAKSCKGEEEGYLNSSTTTTKRKRTQSICAMNISTEKVVVALKCSLTLGLSIFLGLLFSKENGYWAGLTVAITFTPPGQATFRLASLRAHGTAVGSVFGVLGTLISQNRMELRFLSLVPWVVFTCFLQRSRMYGQPGAISAVLSAMIIIGRKNYGSPVLFTIERLVESYIALCVAIVVELLLQPTRASTLARSQLDKSLEMLHQCIDSITSLGELKEKEKKLRNLVKELKDHIGEAELEPNFWFLPFPFACYNKLHGSLAKMGNLLVILLHSMEVLSQECYEIEENMKEYLDKFKGEVGGLVKCLKVVIQEKPLQNLKKELEGKGGCKDIEVGKEQSSCESWGLSRDREECEKIIGSFLQHSTEVVEGLDHEDGAGDLKSQLVLCFATIGHCMGGLMREVREMEGGILELVQGENTSSHINLFKIPCKIREVST